MLQRIQSVFLFLAAASAFALLMLPFATSDIAVESSDYFMDGRYNIHDSIGLLVLFLAAALLSLASIFMYKNRKNQLLAGRFGIIANIIGLILAIVLYMNESDQIPDSVAINDDLGLYMPLLFLVFALLAQRYITNDEMLVRSMDRLR